jgi:hypothetical protein
MDYFNNNSSSSAATPSSQGGSDYLSESSSTKSSSSWIIIILLILLAFFGYLVYDFYATVLKNGHMDDTASQKLSLFGSFFYDFFTKTPGTASKDASVVKDASGNVAVKAKDASGNVAVKTKDASGNNQSSPYPNTNTSSIKQPGTTVGDQSANQNPNNPLNRALQYNEHDEDHQLYNLPQAQDYCADEACSSIQNSKPASKAGWCFVGTDRGFRSCVEVGEQDKCMSGEIFPRQDICVNPSLR